MAVNPLKLGELQQKLLDAGIPIVSVGVNEGDTLSVSLEFDPAATNAQKDAARTMAASFEWRDRKRSVAKLRTWYQGLSAADKNKLQILVNCIVAMQNPDLLKAFDIDPPFDDDATPSTPPIINVGINLGIKL